MIPVLRGNSAADELADPHSLMAVRRLTVNFFEMHPSQTNVLTRGRILKYNEFTRVDNV